MSLNSIDICARSCKRDCHPELVDQILCRVKTPTYELTSSIVEANLRLQHIALQMSQTGILRDTYVDLRRCCERLWRQRYGESNDKCEL
jgi:hypothetical protein